MNLHFADKLLSFLWLLSRHSIRYNHYLDLRDVLEFKVGVLPFLRRLWTPPDWSVQIYEEQNSTNWWFLSCFQFPRCGFAFTEIVGWRKLKSKEHKGISVEVFSCYWACVLLNAILYDFLLPVKSLRSSSYYVRFSEKMCIRMTEAVSVKSAKESAATWCGTCFLLSTKLFQVPVWNRVS